MLEGARHHNCSFCRWDAVTYLLTCGGKFLFSATACAVRRVNVVTWACQVLERVLYPSGVGQPFQSRCGRCGVLLARIAEMQHRFYLPSSPKSSTLPA